MINKFVSAAAWACLAFIVFATLSPLNLRPALTETEPPLVVMLERFGAFAMLGFLLVLGYPNRTAAVLVIVLGGAVVLELAQTVVPCRDPRIVDLIEKLVGGSIGILAACQFVRKVPRF
jgi:VanZ family protein